MNKLAIDIGTTFLGTGSKLTDPTNIGNYISAIITGAISVLLGLLLMAGVI